jgi:hypothetical protein
VWPSLREISLTKGYGSTLSTFKWLPPGGSRADNLTRSEYSLLPAFLDGLLLGMAEADGGGGGGKNVMATTMSLTENYENYFLQTEADFRGAFAMAKRGAASLSRQP